MRKDREWRAVIVGVGDYLAPAVPLPFASGSARRLAATLQLGYTFQKIVVINNRSATKTGILDTIRCTFDGLGKGDGALLAFFGHSVARQKGKKWWFVPFGVPCADRDHTKFLTDSELLSEVLPEIPASHRLTIVDTCYSGLLLAPRRAVDVPEDLQAESLIDDQMSPRSESSYLIVSGSPRDRVPDGGGTDCSKFVHMLTRCLDNADSQHVPALNLACQMRTLASKAREHSLQRIRPYGDFIDGDKWHVFCFARRERETYEALIECGQRAYDNGQHEDAIRFWYAATLLEPDWAWAFTKLGDAYYTIGENERALAAFQRSQEIEPDDQYVKPRLQKLTELAST